MDSRNFERYGRRSRLRRGRPSVFAGLFLVIIGGLLLAHSVCLQCFPVWFFTWPMFMIGLGLFLGLRHNFRGVAWLIFLILGSVFLADNISQDIVLKPYVWPIVLITVGIYIMFGKRRCRPRRFGDRGFGNSPNDQNNYIDPMFGGETNDSSDVIDITAVFSGVKKQVLSKNFRGGDITAFMGGAEINLTKADFQGRAVLDVTNIFGGTKLVVPPDWDVQSDVVAIFGGVDDKRNPSGQHDPAKVVFLEGTCIFGGIEIRSF